MRNQSQMQFQFNKGTLEEICETSNLINAFKLVKKNKGAPGVDGITIEEFETNLLENIQGMGEVNMKSRIRTRTYGSVRGRGLPPLLLDLSGNSTPGLWLSPNAYYFA